MELTSFVAQAIDQDKQVTLNWSTASEQNCYQWIVERSTTADGSYRELGTLNGNGSSNQAHSYKWQDQGLAAGQDYYYRLAEVGLNNAKTYFGPVRIRIATPSINMLSQAYPNPSAGQFSIRYQLKDGGPVSLKVYNLAGQVVKTLVNQNQKADYYRVQWNGRNDAGQKVSAGVYIYRLEVNGYSAVKRMMILR